MPTGPKHTAAPSGNPLATQAQLVLEDLAMRLHRSQPVREAIARCRELLQADPRAKTASGRATLEIDLNEQSFLACGITAAANPDDPKVYWGLNLPHNWFGRKVEGSRTGIDNPDNVYRMIAIDDQSSYVTSGRVPAVPPVDVSFTVFPVWPGVIDAKGVFPPALGGVTLKELDVDPSGQFILSADPSPAAGRRNHLQVKPGANVVFVRDSMSDWAREMPLYLSVRRVAGPPVKPPRDEETLSRIAAQNVERSVRFWLDLPAHYYYRGEVNRLVTVSNPAFAKGGQFTANGNLDLRPDEAYVLTLDPLGADYVSVQLADLFGSSLDYAHHTASLSQSQMALNEDGTITYVISLKDPGVYNWLDPAGLDRVLFMFRYQGYDPDRVTPEAAIRLERTVKCSELEKVLPRETRWVAPQERDRQLAERLATYNRRLSEVFSSVQ
jgi:hypothetical protein